MKFFPKQNLVLQSKAGRPFLADAFIPEKEGRFPLLVFCHGYKGFKDWGAWKLMAEKFAKNGFYVVTFNFSHNGITTENTSSFSDLDAFGNNNYSLELDDLGVVIDHFIQEEKVDAENITLMGHSRGGGICVIKSSEDSRVKNLITLASVDTLDRFPTGEKLEEWKQNGVYETYNSRTKQQMPHYIQFLEDYQNNQVRLNVEKAMKRFSGRSFILHGKEDEAIPVTAAKNLLEWADQGKLLLLEKANHTFGAKEPWKDFKLPLPLNIVVNECIAFLHHQ